MRWLSNETSQFCLSTSFFPVRSFFKPSTGSLELSHNPSSDLDSHGCERGISDLLKHLYIVIATNILPSDVNPKSKS